MYGYKLKISAGPLMHLFGEGVDILKEQWYAGHTGTLVF